MRTPSGLSIRKLAWPRKVIDTASSEPAAARRSGFPAITPVHAACAPDAQSQATAAAKRRANAKPLSALRGEREGPGRVSAREGEVGGAAVRGIGPPHPTLSPRPAGGEG